MIAKALPYFIILHFMFTGCSSPNKTEREQPTVSHPDTSSGDMITQTRPEILYGIDIYHENGDVLEEIDPLTDSLKFVICKATEGITYQDPKFEENWKLAHDKGFTVGAYHFFESDDASAKQVENYLTTVGTFGEHDLPPIVDFEGAGIHGGDDGAIADTLLKVLELIKNNTGRTPMVYCGVDHGNHYLNAPEFAQYPLWICDYTTGDKPEMPGAWSGTKWWFWQKTDQYQINSKNIDLDLFNGTKANLEEFIANH